MSTDIAERRSYPIYILLDVSASMRVRNGAGRSPHAEFAVLIPDLIMSLADAPSLAATAWISVVAFSDQPQLLFPMTSLHQTINIPEPRSGTETNYTAALKFLLDRYNQDARMMQAHGPYGNYQVRIARPLIFVITDGAPYVTDRYQPRREWLPYRDRLVAAPIGARVAAIGLTGAHPGTLFALATGRKGGLRNAFIAGPDVQGDQLARSVINVIERSIKLSVRAGDMIIDEPDGMRRVDG